MKGGKQSAQNVGGKNLSSSLAPSRQRPQERAKPISSGKKQRLCLCFSTSKSLKPVIPQFPDPLIISSMGVGRVLSTMKSSLLGFNLSPDTNLYFLKGDLFP
jgi:hypothetical protein